MGRGTKHLCAALAVLGLLAWIPAGASAANSMAVQPDGKVVLAGASQSLNGFGRAGALVRFNEDGTLDRGFGVGGGLVDHRIGSGFDAVAVQPDGKIVTASGGVYVGFRVARYLADGRPDSTFGDHGMAAGPPLGSLGGEASPHEHPAVVLLRPDGSIVVGGTVTYTNRYYNATSTAAVVRFDSDGDFEGRLGAVAGMRLADLLAQPDGSLIATGGTDQVHSPDEPSLALARLAPGFSSSYDPAFGGGQGVVRPSLFPSQVPGSAEAVFDLGGRLVTVGSAGTPAGPLVARFDQGGVLDASFGEGGYARPPVPGAAALLLSDAAVQPDGKIAVVGDAQVDGCTGGASAGCFDLAVGRLEADGSFDAGFGSQGLAKLTTAGGERVARATAEDLAVLQDGRLLASGAIASERPGPVEATTFLLARYDQAGSPDRDFGEGGIATALPCQGSVAQLRRSGCIASARVRLRVRRLSSGRPRLRLRVSKSQPLDPILSVRLLLPRSLRARPAFAERLGVVAIGGKKAEPKLHRNGVTANRMGRARAVVMTLGRGLLEARRGIPRGHKLVFGVKVRFQDGSTQTIHLRR